MRRAAKRDDNEPLIVQAIQSAGWTVIRVSSPGFPDLACAKDGLFVPLEVKSDDGDLTPAQEKTFTELANAGVQVPVVRGPSSALQVLGCPYVVQDDGARWVSVNGAFICEHCWLPENGLHAKDCPTRTALKRSPRVQSAHRAAKVLAEAMPKQFVRVYDRDLNLIQENEVPAGTEKVVFRGPETVMTTEGLVYRDKHGVTIDLRPSRGVEGELQPLKVRAPPRVEVCECGHPYSEHIADVCDMSMCPCTKFNERRLPAS